MVKTLCQPAKDLEWPVGTSEAEESFDAIQVVEQVGLKGRISTASSAFHLDKDLCQIDIASNNCNETLDGCIALAGTGLICYSNAV
jgi:hypothetical protein